jgi:predicted nuclease of predicted toxin-antitoxin system
VAEIRFLLDEHLPRAIAQAPRRRGVDVLTAAEAGLLGSPDLEYLTYAVAEQRVLVTRDSDFLRLHEQQATHAGIAYCTHRARTVGQLVNSLLLMHELLDADEMAGRVEYL